MGRFKACCAGMEVARRRPMDGTVESRKIFGFSLIHGQNDAGQSEDGDVPDFPLIPGRNPDATGCTVSHFLSDGQGLLRGLGGARRGHTGRFFSSGSDEFPDG